MRLAAFATCLAAVASTAVARPEVLSLSCTVTGQSLDQVPRGACTQYCRTDIAIDFRHTRAQVGDPVWASWVTATITSTEVSWAEPGYVDDSGTYGTQYYRFNRADATLSESNTFRLGTWYNTGPGGSSETYWNCTPV